MRKKGSTDKLVRSWRSGVKIEKKKISDATWLLNEAGVGQLVSYPYFKKATATDLIKKYYSGLSRETLIKLYDTYRLDFELFGYGIPDYLMAVSDTKL